MEKKQRDDEDIEGPWNPAKWNAIPMPIRLWSGKRTYEENIANLDDLVKKGRITVEDKKRIIEEHPQSSVK